MAVFGKAMYASSRLGILFTFSMMAFVLAGSIILCSNGATWHGPDYLHASEIGGRLHATRLLSAPDHGWTKWRPPYVNILSIMLGSCYDDDHGLWRPSYAREVGLFRYWWSTWASSPSLYPCRIGTNFTREYDAYREMERRVAEKKKLRWKASLRRVVKNTPGGKGKVGAAPSPPAKNPDKELLEQLRSTLHQQKLGLEEISAKVEGIAARVLKT